MYFRPAIRVEMSDSLKQPINESRIEGNDVTLLKNGDEIFPAMLSAISGAAETICFETFVYWSGDIAQEFASALEERAKAGVKVHVILDWHGAKKMSQNLTREMKAAGVEVEYYRPLRWFNLRRTNYRTHRKLLVVDGKIGFAGGVGVADEWNGHAQDADHWRDNHYRFEGPIVREMLTTFFKNWERCQHEVPNEKDRRYYPELSHVGNDITSAVRSAPYENDFDLFKLFMDSADSTEERLWIATAYFIPGKKLVRALREAARRGVSVKILMCGGHIDKKIVRMASRSIWGNLLESGIQLFEYQPTLLHVKMLIVDDAYVSVGSANVDARSCYLNDEFNINLYGRHFTKQHEDVFNDDLQKSREITMDDWESRSWWTKITDYSARIVRDHL
ncbi:MAG: cardiolipin synthase [Verrucomicrobiales bacterium]